MTELDLKQNYRNTIGLFATGVTVLAIENEGQVYCMTANAVSSLSLEPIQLLVCPSKKSWFSKFIKKDVVITVSILGIHQEDVSNYFASSKQKIESSKLHYDYLFSENINTPRLKDCIASFACRIRQIYDGGDHWIVVGEVEEMYKNEQKIQPLLFFGGNYHYPSTNEEEHIKPSSDPYK